MPRQRHQKPGLRGYIRLNCLKFRISDHYYRPSHFPFCWQLSVSPSKESLGPPSSAKGCTWVESSICCFSGCVAAPKSEGSLPCLFTKPDLRGRGSWLGSEIVLVWTGRAQHSPCTPSSSDKLIPASLVLVEKGACEECGYKGDIFYIKL